MSEPLPEKVPPIPKPKGQGKGLTQKVGPLPVWAWGAILVGGIAFVLYVRSKSKSSTAFDSTPATGTIFDQGGGPPSAPANGVVGGSSTNPCPAGYDYIGGACVPSATPPTSDSGNPPGPSLYGPPTGSIPFITTPTAPDTPNAPAVKHAVATTNTLANERIALIKARNQPPLRTAKKAK